MKIRYFDHAATTPVSEAVLKEMLPFFTQEYGNSSSMYLLGRNAKRALEQARSKVASYIGAQKNEIYFTSCGSESDNLAIKGVAYANCEKGKHIITSKIEHPAVLNSCKSLEKEGFEVTYLNVDENGLVDLEQLVNSIRQDTIFITIMYANNEIGTIQPIQKIAEIAHRHGIIFHTDSVQAVGSLKINVKEEQIDLLSMSGHKLYAPKGVGALYVKEGIAFQKLQDGGHQESNKRAGTENVASIVGLGKAMEEIYENFEGYHGHLSNLREQFITQIEKQIPQAKLNGDRKNRLPGNANFSFPYISGQELLLKLDEVGICASSGSACSSGSSMPSHVLTAIGLKAELASSALRITFGKENTKEDVNYLVKKITEIIENKEK